MKTKYIDMPRLLTDHGIEYHEASNGWLQLACPFCYKGDGKFGLGWSGTVFNCFHCGRLDRLDTLNALLGTEAGKTLHTLSQYTRGTKPRPAGSDASSTVAGGTTAVKLPYGTGRMEHRHREYLRNRHFNAERLEREWGLLGTGNLGSYAHRIIIPVYQGGKLVCYQGRDITGLSRERYKSCPDSEALVPIKDCLYGLEKVTSDSTIVTEGPTKVWRLGPGHAVGTWGANVTKKQVELLMRFRRLFIVFDEDEAGEENADKLARELVVLGTYCTIVTTGVRDVGDLKQEEADTLVQDLLKNSFYKSYGI